MPILFSLVARGTVILAEFASCAGNFTEVAEQVIAKIPRKEYSKLACSHKSYLFHYVTEGGFVYLCITDDDFEQSKAFVFLNKIKTRFEMQCGARAKSALPYAMNREFSRVLATQMRIASETKEGDVLTKVQEEVDEIMRILFRNIDQIADRGERLELLVDKTEDLNASRHVFRKSRRGLARSMWWKNIKMMAIVSIVIVLLYLITSAVSEGLD